MRILQAITLSEMGGAQVILASIANYLSKEHEVFVVAGDGDSLWELLGDNIIKIKLDNLKREINIFNDFKVLVKLRKLYKDIKPDIIQLHSSKIGALGRLAANKQFQKKIVYTVHGFDTIVRNHKKYLVVEKILKNRCGKILAVSEYDKKNLINVGIDNVKVIYNGVNISSCIEYDKHILDKIYQMKASFKKVVMSISRDYKPKRIDLFFKLAEKYYDVCFIWFGNKYDYDDLPHNVVCFGEITNAHIYLKYSDIFILASDYEGLPVSIIEAFAYGVPVVASNVGGVSELFSSSEYLSFCLVENNDVGEFSKKIDVLFSEESLMNIIVEKERRAFNKYFIGEKMNDSYLKAYEEINK